MLKQRVVLALALAVLVLAPSVMHMHVRADDDIEEIEEIEEIVDEEEEAEDLTFSKEEQAALEEGREVYEFQAEVSRLMDIIVHSLYTNRDIFIRELISNASDALDKLRFLSLTDDEVLGEGDDRNMDIHISFDADSKTVTIRDRGIGMTKQDLIQNLGTVAKSGTSQFVEAITSGADMSLIGQFGVGFYSVYLVSDKVRVVSKHNDDKQHVFESVADGTFSVSEDPRGDTLGRGTEITLFLKEDSHEFTDQSKLDTLIRRYSEFITFPIYLRKSRSETVDVPIEADEEQEEFDVLDEEEVEEVEGEEDEPIDESQLKTRVETITVWEEELINEQKAIWMRARDEITTDEYKSFYKSFAKDIDDPRTWIHFQAEGEIMFRSILYIPQTAPYDLYEDYYGRSSSLRLYVRKVLISDKFEDLMPRYLNFVRGVVDSDDLPLNVSRETLQQNKVLKVMGRKLTRKALEMLRRLAKKEKRMKERTEEEEAEADEGVDVEAGQLGPYTKFWKQFGKNLKLGLVEDHGNRSKLARLVRFLSTSSATDDDFTSLDEYVARMKDWQRSIYYIAGESVEKLRESPFLERFEEKGVEVLFMTDPIDEYAVNNLPEFDGRKLQAITKEGLSFGDEEEVDHKRQRAYEHRYEPLTEYLKTLFEGKVEKVVVSQRVAKTPVVLVTSQYGYSANMERIMRAQTFADPEKQAFMFSKKTMEINPRHPIVADMLRRVEEASDDERTVDLGWMLYDAAVLNSGFVMEDTRSFAGRMYRLMQAGMNLDSLDLEPLLEVTVEEEDDEVDEEELTFDDLDDEEELGHDEL